MKKEKTKTQQRKINETKSWFFDNKIKKTLTRLDMEKMEKMQIL